ncbi:MAG: SDR family oxidoreductase [Saprospiraceae bacterium]
MRKYKDINIGEKESITHKITQEDIDKFVNLTGDDNKLHVDELFAKTTKFKKPVVHGMLGASFISTLIGTRLPGDGALWFSQSLEFLLPVRINDVLTIEAEVTKKHDRENIIVLNVEIKNQNRQVVTRGISKVKVLAQEPDIETTKQEQKNEKYALVLGSTGGLGRAVAKKLSMDGYRVILHYYSNKKLANQIKSEIDTNQLQTILAQADITKKSDLINLLKTVKRYTTKLKVVVNCASIKIPQLKFEELEWKDFIFQYEFHIHPFFEIVSLFFDLIKNESHAKIIAIGSMAVDKPNSSWSHYISAKAALHGFVKALAIELGPKNICVNMVSPSLMETDLTTDIPEKTKLITASQTPLRRLAEVEDVANTISFLASDAANFITGENIRINGGQFCI